MHPGIKHRPFSLAWIESFQSMLLQRAHKDVFRHPETGVQVLQVPVCRIFRWLDSISRYALKRAIEVVDTRDQIVREALDGEIPSRFDVALGSVLEVAEVGDRAEIFVLYACQPEASTEDDLTQTFKSTISLSFASNAFLCASSGAGADSSALDLL